MDNRVYWTEKNERAQKAREHTSFIDNKYHDEINSAISSTKVYDDETTILAENPANYDTEIKVVAQSSTDAIFDNADSAKRLAVLNFASYKNAGGMFINGSIAQEESLCHESFLYNVLAHFTDTYYAWNNQHKNKALYLNRALYTPSVIFERNERAAPCDVITCAAPNISVSRKYGNLNVSEEENLAALDSRIRFVLNIARDNEVDTLILGAFGCGVFAQDAKTVAEIFKKYLNTEFKNSFKRIIFAVPKNIHSSNNEAFVEVFN